MAIHVQTGVFVLPYVFVVIQAQTGVFVLLYVFVVYFFPDPDLPFFITDEK